MSIFKDIADKLMKSKGKNENAPLEPVKDSKDQSPDELKLYEHIKGKIDLSRQTNSRISIEGIYLTNVAYLMGFDGVRYDTTYRQFRNIDPRRKATRNTFKVNKILPQVQNRLARLTQSPPKFDVRPNSNSTSDKDAARLGIKIIEDVLDKQRFNEKRQDLMMSLMQGGHSYAQVLWDPTLGKPMYDPVTGEMTGYEGDVRIEILNCLEVYPDPLAKNIEDAAWIIKAKVRKLEYFKETYPDRGNAVIEEMAWLLSSIYDMKSNGLTSVGITGASTSDQMKNSAIELCYYEKRSKDHPKGRMVIAASGVILEDKELPAEMYDLVKFDDMLIGGRYNSEAVITHMRPVQDQYNITRTKMAEFTQKLLGGKYLAAKEHGLLQEAINDSSTEVVTYNPVPNAAPPSAMSIPVMPPYAYKDLETLDKELDYIIGINEVSRGDLPSASIPASGMAFLQEQDQTRIGVMTSRNEAGYAKIGELILRLVGKNYVLPRMMKTAGEGLGYTVQDFVGKDLQDNYDVMVIPGSTIPTSKVLKRQDIISTYNMGLLGNPQDDKLRMQVLKRLEYGDVADMWKTQSLTQVRIKKCIEAIERGEIPALNEFDNHDQYLLDLNDYRLSEKFDLLDKTKKGLLAWVMEWHINAKTNLQNPTLEPSKMAAIAAIKSSKVQQAQTVDGIPGLQDISQNQQQQGGLVPPAQQQGM